MTAREVKETLVNQLGNEKEAENLYKQIKRSLGWRPLNSIYWLKITLNEWYEGYKLIHFELNNGTYETCINE